MKLAYFQITALAQNFDLAVKTYDLTVDSVKETGDSRMKMASVYATLENFYRACDLSLIEETSIDQELLRKLILNK